MNIWKRKMEYWLNFALTLVFGIYIILSLSCAYYFNNVFENLLNIDSNDKLLKEMGASGVELDIFKDMYTSFNGFQKFLIIMSFGFIWPYFIVKSYNLLK